MRLLRDFFYLQKSDRKILVGLFVIIVAALAIIMVTGGRGGDGQKDDNVSADSTTSFPNDRSRKRSRRPIDEGGPVKTAELFCFDPNTADSTELLRLGLERWQVRNIYRYRRAGGIYRRPEDFARLYGLTAGQYRRMAPYIRISSDYRPASELVAGTNRRPDSGMTSSGGRQGYGNEAFGRDTLRYPVKIREGEHIVLNTADTSELRRVPGIGVYFAKEIIRHGEFLGGYVSVDQLDEITDFPQKAKQYFVISNPQPRRLNVNKLSLTELRRHPYINYYQARDIVDYRRLHGPIKSLQDLCLLESFPPEAIRRLEPYVEY